MQLLRIRHYKYILSFSIHFSQKIRPGNFYKCQVFFSVKKKATFDLLLLLFIVTTPRCKISTLEPLLCTCTKQGSVSLQWAVQCIKGVPSMFFYNV